MAEYRLVSREQGDDAWSSTAAPAFVSEAELFGYLERKQFEPNAGFEYAIIRTLEYTPPVKVGRWR